MLFNVGTTTEIHFALTPCFVFFFFWNDSIFRFACCSLTFPPTTRTLRLTFMVTIRSAKIDNDRAHVCTSRVFLRLADFPDRPRVFRNAYIPKWNSHQRLTRRFDIRRNTTTMYSIFCRLRNNSFKWKFKYIKAMVRLVAPTRFFFQKSVLLFFFFYPKTTIHTWIKVSNK